ncbi:MAG: hypothetical protein EA390_06975 [Balneolaceae bacterium]|nr:MAG: hypothetical protein EA390_06975 [Balneolaceae bacterium]
MKSGIEQTGSEVTGTPVTADRVSISPFSGKGEISGFRVANPGDYSNDYAFDVDDFQIELDIFSLFSDEIVIREIVISAPSIWVEQKLPENNIRTIMRHIQNMMPGEASDKAMVIERFRLTGVRWTFTPKWAVNGLPGLIFRISNLRTWDAAAEGLQLKR